MKQYFLRVGVGLQNVTEDGGDAGLRGAVVNRGVANGDNDWTEGFYGVKRSGSNEQE